MESHARPHAAALIASSTAAVLIASSSAMAADQIRLANDDVLTGQVLDVTDTTIRFSHDLFGELELDSSKVEILFEDDVPPGRSSEDVAMAAMQDGEETVEEKEWSFKFVAAAAYATGNSETKNLSAIFTALRETDEMRTAFDAAYFYAESDGEKSDDKFTAGVVNDWLLPDSKWFIFADARFDYDSFQSWDYRFTAHVGAGYQFIDEDDFSLRGRAGIGVIREWESQNEDWRPEGLLGVEGEWKITERQTLRFDSTVYPDLDDTGEFRAVSNAAWSLQMDEELNLSLTVGARHEYQSQVDPGDDKNDLRVYAGVQFDF